MAKTKKNTAVQLQRMAQQRADEQARRVPWQRLYEERNRYIEWQEFSLWARAIIDSEGRLPGWLASIVEERCPGFLAWAAADVRAQQPVALRLEDWIEQHVFGFAKSEGWFDAIVYYAIRDARYQRAEVCWAQCAKQWRQVRPVAYPSLAQWRFQAASCDPNAHLVLSEKKARRSLQRVTQNQLDEAVARYMEWEAFALWARPALEAGPALAANVQAEIERRCPGFLDSLVENATPPGGFSQRWQQLFTWMTDHFFAQAKAEGWLEAILLTVRQHPRAIRTAEYAEHWEDARRTEWQSSYPSFADWRREADAYLERQAD